jgi:hypothetical protein
VKGFMAKILILCIPFLQNGLSSSKSRSLIILVEAERRSREAPNGISAVSAVNHEFIRQEFALHRFNCGGSNGAEEGVFRKIREDR